jgi:hypothetical protein
MGSGITYHKVQTIGIGLLSNSSILTDTDDQLFSINCNERTPPAHNNLRNIKPIVLSNKIGDRLTNLENLTSIIPSDIYCYDCYPYTTVSNPDVSYSIIQKYRRIIYNIYINNLYKLYNLNIYECKICKLKKEFNINL